MLDLTSDAFIPILRLRFTALLPSEPLAFSCISPLNRRFHCGKSCLELQQSEEDPTASLSVVSDAMGVSADVTRTTNALNFSSAACVLARLSSGVSILGVDPALRTCLLFFSLSLCHDHDESRVHPQAACNAEIALIVFSTTSADLSYLLQVVVSQKHDMFLCLSLLSSCTDIVHDHPNLEPACHIETV